MFYTKPQEWRPAPMRSPVLGQTAQPQTLDQMMGGPKLALTMDLAAVGVGGIILYTYLKGEQRPFVGFWVVATTAALVKAFHDISRL